MSEGHMNVLQLGAAFLAASPFLALLGWRARAGYVWIAFAGALAVIGAIVVAGQLARFA